MVKKAACRTVIALFGACRGAPRPPSLERTRGHADASAGCSDTAPRASPAPVEGGSALTGCPEREHLGRFPGSPPPLGNGSARAPHLPQVARRSVGLRLRNPTPGEPPALQPRSALAWDKAPDMRARLGCAAPLRPCSHRSPPSQTPPPTEPAWGAPPPPRRRPSDTQPAPGAGAAASPCLPRRPHVPTSPRKQPSAARGSMWLTRGRAATLGAGTWARLRGAAGRGQSSLGRASARGDRAGSCSSRRLGVVPVGAVPASRLRCRCHRALPVAPRSVCVCICKPCVPCKECVRCKTCPVQTCVCPCAKHASCAYSLCKTCVRV